MDVRLLGMLAAVALLTTGLFGLAPALHASRRGTADGLKEGGRMSATPKTRRWTHALLVGQFALTLALLHGAGVTGKAFYKAYALDRNVQTSDAVTTFVRLPPQTYATPEQQVRVTIVGLSPDIRQGREDAVPVVYLPFRAEAPAAVTLIMRGSGGPARVVSAARQAAHAIDPDLALGVMRTLDELRDRSRGTGLESQFAKVG